MVNWSTVNREIAAIIPKGSNATDVYSWRAAKEEAKRKAREELRTAAKEVFRRKKKNNFHGKIGGIYIPRNVGQ